MNKSYFCNANIIMKNYIRIGFWSFFSFLMMALTSCHKPVESPNKLLAGHWGCEQYVSYRTFEDGTERWDTLNYEVGPGKGYEVFFYEDGTGQLLLNDSPAYIKKFDCNFEYDTVTKKLTIYNTSWILSIFSSETSADMDIEEITDTRLQSSWINHFSEPTPFFERFFLKRID